MDTAYLSDEPSALPEKKVVTSRQPRLPTPWTWKRAEDSSAGLCWEHAVSKDQGEDEKCSDTAKLRPVYWTGSDGDGRMPAVWAREATARRA